MTDEANTYCVSEPLDLDQIKTFSVAAREVTFDWRLTCYDSESKAIKRLELINSNYQIPFQGTTDVYETRLDYYWPT